MPLTVETVALNGVLPLTQPVAVKKYEQVRVRLGFRLLP